MSDAASRPVLIEEIEGDADRVEARLRVSEPRFVRTRSLPGLAARVLESYPDMVRHRCECGSARGIESELRDTETAHLIEHLSLELMVERGASRELRGETRWDFARDGKGVFRVSIALDPKQGATRVMAEECLRQGADLINEMIGELSLRE